MNFFDRFIEKDGKVDGPIRHILIWVSIGVGAAFLIHVLNAFAFPLAVGGGVYAGYQTWKADERINGD